MVVLALVDNSENENGIIPDYETIDHSKIQILGLTLIPDSINTPYLQLIAALIRILQDDENQINLFNAIKYQICFLLYCSAVSVWKKENIYSYLLISCKYIMTSYACLSPQNMVE